MELYYKTTKIVTFIYLHVLTLSNEGITTPASGFNDWKNIKNEIVGYETIYQKSIIPDNRANLYYLYYELASGNVKVYLYGLSKNHWKIAKLLRIYRGRSNDLANLTH
jgi:hypothetical protein